MNTNNNYTIISGNKYFNFYTFLVIFADVLLFFQLNNKLGTKIISILILDAFAFLILYGLFYSFYYNKEEIIIKHLWTKKEIIYKMQELTDIKLKSVPTFGKVVVLYTKNGRKRGFGAAIIGLELLNKMILDIKQYISD